MIKKRGLGKGLDALLGSYSHPIKIDEKKDNQTQSTPSEEGLIKNDTPAKDHSFLKIPLDLLERGRYQPRHDMDPESLEELAESIKQQGIIQPIIVRPIGDKTRYEIIAGERRWRAAQLAGLNEVPAILRDISDESAIAMSLIENIQRENLNPIEEANALKRLLDEFEMTHQEVAQAVGKSRTTITNFLRLLNLNTDVKILLERSDLEMGHAKALLALTSEQQTEAARMVVAKALSVRETENLVRHILSDKPKTKSALTMDPNIRSLQETLSEKLCAKVALSHNAKGKGKLVISYNTLDELEGILAHIQG